MNSQNELIGDVNSHGNGNDFVHNADTIGNKNSFIVIGTTQETSNGYTDIFVSKIVCPSTSINLTFMAPACDPSIPFKV